MLLVPAPVRGDNGFNIVVLRLPAKDLYRLRLCLPSSPLVLYRDGISPSNSIEQFFTFLRGKFQSVCKALLVLQRVAPPLVSNARKLIPQAQANSILGYRKNAVLPTPDAPIMRQCTSSRSTSASSCLPRCVLPRISPCTSGKFFPARHEATSNGTLAYDFLISCVVSQRAVPCCPSPSVLCHTDRRQRFWI